MTTLLLAAGLQILTLPVAANLIARSTYMAEGIAHHVDTVDELAGGRGGRRRGARAGRPAPPG